MKTTITINDDLIDNVMAYTHSSTIAEAVNIALKDWMVFHRMRELSKKLANNSMYINSRLPVRESKVYNIR
jgi:Arc/MetJ family transcription regulator